MKLRDLCEDVVSFADKKRERELKQTKKAEQSQSQVVQFKNRASKLGVPVKK